MVLDGEVRWRSKSPEGDGWQPSGMGLVPSVGGGHPEFVGSRTEAPAAEDGPHYDHPVGAWYAEERGRWTIFRQDREAKPGDVAPTVFVTEGSPR
jgi:hypothetical protein